MSLAKMKDSNGMKVRSRTVRTKMSMVFPLPSERKYLYLHQQSTDKGKMIIADLSAACRYYALHPRMKELMEYILHHDFNGQEAGRITLDSGSLFINLDEVELKTKDRQRLEFHKRYIDVQVPLLKEETMGWTPMSRLGIPDIAYHPDTDCGFYTQEAKEYFKVRPGQFVLFFPEDAHAPVIGEGRQRKLVGKIRI
ncbi:YhcH/YjgK/YiaL family protein [Prevotella denticola CRIS 18C-A]|uniref:YhcH/YjgK/YiaL family protein n=2 Tax=Prevotella denticola TaxID=28129 RepID=F0HAH8_9BACT|nr:YhcH/YjgK/YiaL family protein [Prevotella denticola CRIS 18C-A]